MNAAAGAPGSGAGLHTLKVSLLARMLLDEPGAGLAPNLVNEVFRTLLLLRDHGMTLVVVEQNARSILRH